MNNCVHVLHVFFLLSSYHVIFLNDLVACTIRRSVNLLHFFSYQFSGSLYIAAPAQNTSPVSKRKKKKELGKSGKRRENLHTGSVFCAEQDWTGYKSDFLVDPVKKRVFSKKKHFEVTLMPS